MDGSATDEVGRALFEEGVDSLAIIFGVAEAAHGVALVREFLVQRVRPAFADHLLDRGEAERRRISKEAFAWADEMLAAREIPPDQLRDLVRR